MPRCAVAASLAGCVEHVRPRDAGGGPDRLAAAGEPGGSVLRNDYDGSAALSPTVMPWMLIWSLAMVPVRGRAGPVLLVWAGTAVLSYSPETLAGRLGRDAVTGMAAGAGGCCGTAGGAPGEPANAAVARLIEVTADLLEGLIAALGLLTEAVDRAFAFCRLFGGPSAAAGSGSACGTPARRRWNSSRLTPR